MRMMINGASAKQRGNLASSKSADEQRHHSGNGNASWLCRLRLRQRQREHTILQLRIDLLLINDTAQRERAPIRADVVLRVHRLEPVVLREVDPALDAQHT